MRSQVLIWLRSVSSQWRKLENLKKNMFLRNVLKYEGYFLLFCFFVIDEECRGLEVHIKWPFLLIPKALTTLCTGGSMRAPICTVGYPITAHGRLMSSGG